MHSLVQAGQQVRAAIERSVQGQVRPSITYLLVLAGWMTSENRCHTGASHLKPDDPVEGVADPLLPKPGRRYAARLRKRVNWGSNSNLAVPTGPLRCLTTLTSVMPLSAVSGL